MKIIIFGSIGVVLAVAFGYVFSIFAIGASYYYLLAATTLALLYLTFFILQVIFISQRNTAVMFIALQVLGMTLPLFRQPSQWLLLIGVITFLVLWWAHERGRRHLDNMVKISFIKLRHHVLVFASAIIVVFMIASYMVFIGQKPLSLSQPTFNFIIKPLEPAIAKILPGFSLNDSVGNVLESVAYRTYEDLDPDRLQSAISELQESISQAFNIQLFLEENVVDASHRAVNSGLGDLSRQFKGILLLILGLLFFTVIGGGTYFINLVIGLFAWLIYRLLLETEFVYITYKKVDQEIVNL
ncbi:MAG: hypothetical protein ABH822_01275 [Patescibacteria group bacterium]